MSRIIKSSSNSNVPTRVPFFYYRKALLCFPSVSFQTSLSWLVFFCFCYKSQEFFFPFFAFKCYNEITKHKNLSSLSLSLEKASKKSITITGLLPQGLCSPGKVPYFPILKRKPNLSISFLIHLVCIFSRECCANEKINQWEQRSCWLCWREDSAKGWVAASQRECEEAYHIRLFQSIHICREQQLH